MVKEKLRYIHNYKGYTIQQMADWFGVPRNTYEKWLYGGTEPTIFYQHSINALYDQAKRERDKEINKMFALGTAGLLALGALWLNSKNDEDDSEGQLKELKEDLINE